jgi:hypothetical protein
MRKAASEKAETNGYISSYEIINRAVSLLCESGEFRKLNGSENSVWFDDCEMFNGDSDINTMQNMLGDQIYKQISEINEGSRRRFLK